MQLSMSEREENMAVKQLLLYYSIIVSLLTTLVNMEVLCYVYGCYAEASIVTVIVNRGLAAVCLVVGPYIIKLIYEDLKNTSPVIQSRVVPKKQSTLEKSPINTRGT